MYGAMLGAYNTVAGLGMAQFNNELAREQQSHYLGLNYMYNERAAHNADIRTRRLYADFYSPEALMRQYEKAGLSPSMMFGGTPGQGGMSGAQGAGAAGPVGATYGVSLLEAAQAANLMAQTDKTKAETDTIEGKNKRGLAEIANTLADSNYKQAAADLTKLQGDWQEVENQWQGNFKELSYENLQNSTEILEWQAKSAKWQAKRDKLEYKWNKELYDNQVNPHMEQVRNMMADTVLKGAQKHLTEAEEKETRQKIQYMIDDIFIKQMHLGNETFLVDFDKNLKEAEAEFYKRSKEIMGEVTNEDQFNKWMDMGGKILTAGANIAALYFLKGAKLPAVVPPVTKGAPSYMY